MSSTTSTSSRAASSTWADVVPGQSLLTYSDLLREIDRYHDRARAKAPWARLREVVTALADGADRTDDLVADHRWHLASVTVSGFQGVGEDQPLTLALDPTPGVTVIHGPNGSGKSNLGDAVKLALEGARGTTSRRASGAKIPLWPRDSLGRGASSARVDLDLRDGDQRLEIIWELDRAGELTWAVSRHVDGTTQDVEPGEPWRSALSAHPPVFSYAAHERQLQLSGDLKQHLEDLLALGGCFSAVQEEIARRSQACTAAADRFNEAWAGAHRRLGEVDAGHGIEGAPGPVPLERPRPDADPAGWLTQSGLPAVPGDTGPVIAVTDVEVARQACREARAALDRLAETAISVIQTLREPLRLLAWDARHLDQPAPDCPVCGRHSPDWRHTLDLALARTGPEHDTARDAAASAVRRLHDAASPVLRSVTEVPDPDADPRRDDARAHLRLYLERFLTAVANDGHSPQAEVRQAALALADAVDSEPVRSLAEWAITSSAHQRRWAAQRREAVEPFLVTWQADGTLAAESDGWQETKRKLDELKAGLRGKRAATLTRSLATRIEQLLPDHGIQVHDVEVRGRDARIDLSDLGGALELSMLSAGQRNAVLLAPLLAVADRGPFGFLILDDPVHAFDGLRVDHLAGAIAALAEHRRVVVLTHDERLKELLIARTEHCDPRMIHRDASTGAVTIGGSGPIWQQLLRDAGLALTLASDAQAGDADGTADVVRGLCRLAVDDALRTFVLRRCLRDGLDWKPDVERLDRESTTRARFRRAGRLCKDNDADRR